MRSSRSVLVVTSEWPSADAPLSGSFVKREVDALVDNGLDVEVHPFRGASDPRAYLRARRSMRERLRSKRFDLVHAHFGQSGLVALGLERPVVVTFHGSDLNGVVGSDGRYTRKGKLLVAVSRYVARRVDARIVVSSGLVQRLPKGVDATVIGVGIDLDTFRPGSRADVRARLCWSNERRYILFAGDPDVPVKRFSLAQHAVGLLGRDANVELITMQGLAPEEVNARMVASDLLLVTSKHEGGPLVVKEAIASDLPVVSVDVGGVRSWIADLDGCRVVDSDDPTAIAGAIDDVLRRSAPFSGQDRARTFGVSAIATQIIAQYDRVISDHAG